MTTNRFCIILIYRVGTDHPEFKPVERPKVSTKQEVLIYVRKEVTHLIIVRKLDKKKTLEDLKIKWRYYEREKKKD